MNPKLSCTCYSFVFVNCATPLTSQHADISGRGLTHLMVKVFNRSFFLFYRKDWSTWKAEYLERGRNNRRNVAKEDKNQRYTSYFSILLRSSDAIIYSFIHSIRQTFIECKQIIFYIFLLSKKDFCVVYTHTHLCSQCEHEVNPRPQNNILQKNVKSGWS